MQRSPRSPLPLVALFCGALSVGLILWSRHSADPFRVPRNENPPVEWSDPASGVAKPPEAPETPAPIETPPPLPEESPMPSEAVKPPPAPSVPPSPPSATPSPQTVLQPETPLDFAALASTPQVWPSHVTLKAPVRFPVFINGAEVGNVQAPPGETVALRKVEADGQVEIGRQSSVATVKAEATDLLSRVRALAALQAAKAANPPQPSPTAAPSAGPAAAPSPEAGPGVILSVKRDRRTETAPGNDARKTWLFHLQLKNQTAHAYPGLRGRLFVFSRGDHEALTLAASQELKCDLEPNGTTALEAAPVTLEPATPFDGYAILFRDANGNIVASSSTRESATQDWAALEAMRPGAAFPAAK